MGAQLWGGSALLKSTTSSVSVANKRWKKESRPTDANNKLTWLWCFNANCSGLMFAFPHLNTTLLNVVLPGLPEQNWLLLSELPAAVLYIWHVKMHLLDLFLIQYSVHSVSSVPVHHWNWKEADECRWGAKNCRLWISLCQTDSIKVCQHGHIWDMSV